MVARVLTVSSGHLRWIGLGEADGVGAVSVGIKYAAFGAGWDLSVNGTGL